MMSALQLMSPFPTYVGAKQWENTDKLNTALRLHVHRKRGDDPEGIYRSNTAGTWHSDDKCLTWTEDAGKQLSDMFGECFRTFVSTYGAHDGGECKIKMSAWAMLYREGGYATVHTHPNCHLSGVYYVDEGETEQITMATGVRVRPGDLEFIDTRSSAGSQLKNLVLQPSFRLTPKAGLMVVFPSWLPHFVHPVKGAERISIACNATILKYAPPPKEESKPHDIDK